MWFVVVCFSIFIFQGPLPYFYSYFAICFVAEKIRIEIWAPNRLLYFGSFFSFWGPFIFPKYRRCQNRKDGKGKGKQTTTKYGWAPYFPSRLLWFVVCFSFLSIFPFPRSQIIQRPLGIEQKRGLIFLGHYSPTMSRSLGRQWARNIRPQNQYKKRMKNRG